MADDKAQPGDPLRIKASTWNSVVDAANDYEQRRRLGTGGRGERSPISHTSIKVRNDSGADRRFGEVLEISSSPLLDDLEAGALWFIGVEPEADGRVYGITRRPIRDGAIDELQIAGVVRAWVNVTDEGHKYARVKAGEAVLQSAFGGTAQIVYKPTGTGELLCAVLLGMPAANQWIEFTLDGTLATTDATAAVTVVTASWTNTAPTSTITVKNLATHTGGTYVFEGDSGDHGKAEYRVADDSWHVYQMECP